MKLAATELTYAGVKFALGPQALTANGQTIDLPAGKFNRVYVIAASTDGDQTATFKAGDKAVDLSIQNWTGYIGQWDNRIWQDKEMVGLKPGYIKPAQVAWFASHHHNAVGANEAYAFSYLFAYPIDLPPGAKTITLPSNDKIRIMAISMANEPGPIANTFVGDKLR